MRINVVVLLSLLVTISEAHFYNTRGFDTISRVLREKDWDGVPDVFTSIVTQAPVLAGLARRRLLEGELWKTPVTKYMSPSITQSKICKDCDNLKIIC